MIERLWQLLLELWGYLGASFDPVRDTLDIVLVTLGIYWLLLLIRGTRAVQILIGLIVLIVAWMAAEMFQLVTLRLILDNFLSSAVLIIIVLFQHDIRRALARVGRGFFPAVSAQQESQMLEEIVRASQMLSQKRVGALIVLERETGLDDQIESGSPIDATISKELLTSLFLPYSPLHDGAVIIQHGRISQAGCILPLTLRSDLPEGVGTRHRAAVGITEETDALVIVVSEETATISVVLGGEMIRGLDAPRLRVVLTEVLTGERRELRTLGEGPRLVEPAADADDTEQAGPVETPPRARTGSTG
jgi:diadenylate cyclase